MGRYDVVVAKLTLRGIFATQWYWSLYAAAGVWVINEPQPGKVTYFTAREAGWRVYGAPVVEQRQGLDWRRPK